MELRASNFQKILWAIFTSLCLDFQLTIAQEIQLTDRKASFYLNDSIRFFIDKTSRENLTEISKPENQKRFTLSYWELPKIAGNKATIWGKIIIQNKKKTNAFLIDFTYQNHPFF